jgi:adenine-specific DNA-methyltransferase
LNEKSQTLPVSEIVIANRFRKDYDGRGYQSIDSLVDSIQRNGLFHPIIVDRSSKQLIAGGRRLSAVTRLGWPEVPVRYLDELSETEILLEQERDLTFRKIELEENLNRKDLTPVEQALLTAEIHNIQVQINGPGQKPGRPSITQVLTGTPPPKIGWHQSDTAKLRGISEAAVNRDLKIAAAAHLMPSIATVKGGSSTHNILKQVDRLAERLELELDRRQRATQYSQFESSVLCGDATSLILKIETGSIDCIITDPPYGVDYGTGSGRGGSNDDFGDDPVETLALLRSITIELRRVLKPSGHVYAFFSTNLWAETINIWKAAGFDVQNQPCIWVKPGNATGVGDWDHHFAGAYEPFLFATNDTRRLAFKRKNVFTYEADSPQSRHHPTQKPVELLRELIQLSTSPNDIILDPFAGSGSTLVAASQLRRKFVGIELNNHFHKIALKRLIDEGKDVPFIYKPEP